MNAVMSGYIDHFVLVCLDSILVYSDNAEDESFYKLTDGKGFSLYSTDRAYALQTETKSVYLPDICPICTYINSGALYSQPGGKYPLIWAELHDAL